MSLVVRFVVWEVEVEVVVVVEGFGVRCSSFIVVFRRGFRFFRS